MHRPCQTFDETVGRVTPVACMAPKPGASLYPLHDALQRHDSVGGKAQRARRIIAHGVFPGAVEGKMPPCPHRAVLLIRARVVGCCLGDKVEGVAGVDVIRVADQRSGVCP